MNEQAGFRWLRRAAELAVTDLEKGRQGDMSAVKVSPREGLFWDVC